MPLRVSAVETFLIIANQQNTFILGGAKPNQMRKLGDLAPDNVVNFVPVHLPVQYYSEMFRSIPAFHFEKSTLEKLKKNI